MLCKPLDQPNAPVRCTSAALMRDTTRTWDNLDHWRGSRLEGPARWLLPPPLCRPEPVGSRKRSVHLSRFAPAVHCFQRRSQAARQPSRLETFAVAFEAPLGSHNRALVLALNLDKAGHLTTASSPSSLSSSSGANRGSRRGSRHRPEMRRDQGLPKNNPAESREASSPPPSAASRPNLSGRALHELESTRRPERQLP